MKRNFAYINFGQKFLTISESVCYSGVHLDMEKADLYHGLCRENGRIMRDTRNNLFHTSYFELIEAHLSGNKQDLNRLCMKLQKDLKPYAAKLASNYPFTTIDYNDFIQEGLIAVSEYLPRYRYICPECDERFRRMEDFEKHCVFKHGNQLEAKPDIRAYLSGVIKGSMLNFLRRQFRLKRTPVVLVRITDFVEEDKSQLFIDTINPSPEDLVASKEAVDKIRLYLDRERNEKIKLFVQKILEGKTTTEAYTAISDSKFAASPESARVTIYQLKQSSRGFAKYRDVLAG